MKNPKRYTTGDFIKEYNLNVAQNLLTYRLKKDIEDINEDKKIITIKKSGKNGTYQTINIVDKEGLYEFYKESF